MSTCIPALWVLMSSSFRKQVRTGKVLPFANDTGHPRCMQVFAGVLAGVAVVLAAQVKQGVLAGRKHLVQSRLTLARCSNPVHAIFAVCMPLGLSHQKKD